MTTLLAHITIKPGCEAEFERIMAFMVESTLSVEDGVVRYEYFKGQKPNFYYCLLSFRDKWAFYDHQNCSKRPWYMRQKCFWVFLKDVRLLYL